jgi:hypothetical protein
MFGIAFALDVENGKGGGDFFQVLRRQLDPRGCEVFF